ncbi:MAG: NifU family protein [Rhodopseudomonas palustris]|uniref:NifU family protein n=1 Tax=Rhodopseudomonas palustris TaxID=1076 RepID=A0A933S2P4_RHOPL|nr:NifU family protein [Rhodopseudomonas palustris]
MKLAASTLGLPPFNHLYLLPRLRAIGVEGIEIAPDHTWKRAPYTHEIPFQSVWNYRRVADNAGLAIVGLHTVLGGRLELGLFENKEHRDHTIAHLVHLSAVCRDLGGKTLTLDTRWKATLPEKDAWFACRDFFDELLPQIGDHGTTLCFAPLPENEGDFCLTARECYTLSLALDHPSFAISLDSAPLAMGGETGHTHFVAAQRLLKIFHIDEPGKAPIGSTGQVDHGDMRQHLVAIGYQGWVSIVQRFVPDTIALDELAASVRFVEQKYLRPDTRSGVAPVEATRIKIISDTIAALRPNIQADGGDLELVSVNGNRIEVKLHGKCRACALVGQTLGGVRRRLTSVLNAPVTVVPV